MLVLAWFPILNIYKSPLILGYGSFLLLLLCFLAFIKEHDIKRIMALPKKYYFFWAWCAIAYFISCLPQIKIGAFIPGGFFFFVFTICIGFLVKFFDIKDFKRHTEIVVVITGVVLILQELLYFTTGSRFVAILPFGQLTDDIPVSELIADQMSLTRSCSLFREPAHYAQYLLPLLCLELFSKENREKFFTPYSLFLLVLLIILRSGNGFVGLIFLYAVKVLAYLKRAKRGVVILTAIIAVPLCYYAVSSYISTEVGASMLERSSELENDDSAASYIRVYRGYALYSELPDVNKIIGVNDENLMRIIPRTSIAYLFKGEEQYDLYMNGVQSVLIHYGLIGFLLCVWLYITLLKGSKLMPKMQVWLFLLLSLLGQTFLASIMLFSTLLVITDKKDKDKNYENSVLHKTRV